MDNWFVFSVDIVKSWSLKEDTFDPEIATVWDQTEMAWELALERWIVVAPGKLVFDQFEALIYPPSMVIESFNCT